MPYRDTPHDRLQAALDAVGPGATYVRVEVIDLRAYLDPKAVCDLSYLCPHHRGRTLDWVGKPDANGDIPCSRLAPKRCLWVEGHYGGCATP